jgi:hypothetical protein
MNRTRISIRSGGLLMGALLLGAHALDAQMTPGEFLMSARGDWQTYANSAALDAAPAVAVEATYFLTPQIGVGFQVAAARPWTRGEYFPLGRHTYWSQASANDTTILYVLNQQLTALDFGVQAEYRMAFDRLEPFVQAGVGRYAFYFDRQLQPQSDRDRRMMGGMAFSLGAGLGYAVSEGARVMISASDRIYRGYDREQLSLADRLLREDRFVNPLTPPPAAQDVIHNLRFSAGFSFAPGR